MTKTSLKNKRVLLIGLGFFGQAFHRQLTTLEAEIRVCNSKDDVTEAIKHLEPDLVINAAGFTGTVNVDDCDNQRGKTMGSNVLLPVAIRDACWKKATPWLHLSSGCIFNGHRYRPKKGDSGWTESDPPNFTFNDNVHSFYTGSKFMAEELIGRTTCWICRVRMPFGSQPHPKNYITKLLTYPTLMEAENSLTHLEEGVETMLNLYLTHAPYGVYHVVNKGSITTTQAASLLAKHLPDTAPEKPRFVLTTAEQLNKPIMVEPRSSAILSCAKLQSLQLGMRCVESAFIGAVKSYGEPK